MGRPTLAPHRAEVLPLPCRTAGGSLGKQELAELVGFENLGCLQALTWSCGAPWWLLGLLTALGSRYCRAQYLQLPFPGNSCARTCASFQRRGMDPFGPCLSIYGGFRMCRARLVFLPSASLLGTRARGRILSLPDSKPFPGPASRSKGLRALQEP